MALLYLSLQRLRPHTINRMFGKLQIFSAAGMGFMHGTNDAQKTMGIITLALLTGTASGAFDQLPGWLSFLHTTKPDIALWIKITCAIVMAMGTAAGGWRIIKTLGHKMVKLQPINGFAAEASSATVIFLATHFGIPVSTTHNISAAIMGVGAAKRFGALNFSVIERMIWAWVLTIPVCGAISYGLVRFLEMLNLMK
jgi:PiT family inorganic phosphate transporter